MGKRGISAEKTDETLAKIFKEMTLEQGKTLRVLVEETGISLGRLSDLFNGEKPFYVNDVVNLAAALGVAGSEIFRQAEEALSAEQSSNLVQFPPKTLEDLGITDEDLLKRAAAHKTTTPIHAEYDQHHWEE